MKPNVTTAMQTLIDQIQTALPFDKTEHELCAGKCIGCAKKMLEYMGTELDHYQCQLDNGVTPTPSEISDLARVAKKAHRNRMKNN